MSGMQKLPDDHPMVVAWGNVKSEPDFQSTKEWAASPEYADGSLWHIFSKGWLAAELEASSRLQPQDRLVVELPTMSILGQFPADQRETAANVLLMCKQAVLNSGAAVKMGAWTEGDAAVAELVQEAMQNVAGGKTYTHEEAKQLMAERRAKVVSSENCSLTVTYDGVTYPVEPYAVVPDDLTQFLEQTDFDAAEKVASEKADAPALPTGGEDDCEGCKI